VRLPWQRSQRTCIFNDALVCAGDEPPQPGHQSASASGSVMVELSSNSTALNRCRSGTATVSACTTVCTAAASRSSRNPAAALVQRWSSPCGLMATPAVAAACASSGSAASGWASKPNTIVCANTAPVSFDRRSTKPDRRPRSSATAVNNVRNRSPSCAIVVTRRFLSTPENVEYPQDAESSLLTPSLA